MGENLLTLAPPSSLISKGSFITAFFVYKVVYMKKIIVYFSIFILVFNIVGLSVFAADGDDEGGKNPYPDRQNDRANDWLAETGYITSDDDETYQIVVNALDMFDNAIFDDTFLQRETEITGKVGNKTMSKRDGANALCGLINEYDLKEQMLANIEKACTVAVGYYLVPTVPVDELPSVLFADSAVKDYFVGQVGDKKLVYMNTNSFNGVNSNYFSGGVSADISEYNFVFSRTNFFNNPSSIDYYMNRYQDFLHRWNRYYNYVGMVYFYDSYGNRKTGLSLTNKNNVNQFNALDGGVYGGNADWFVSTDDDFLFVPVFVSTASLTNYLAGNQSIVQSKILQELDFNKFEIDYTSMRDSVWSAIEKGGFANSIELQKIINATITGYLEEIGANTDEMVRLLKRGLFDENNRPYLQIIYQYLDRDLTEALIELLKNSTRSNEILIDISESIVNLPSSGGGSSVDLTETNQKLDAIIALLAINDLPDIDLDIDSPEFNDLLPYINSKFPFCVPYDLYVITSLLGVPEEKPSLVVDFPVMYSEESYEFEIDLSWFDAIRSIWFATCDIGFIIFMLMISLKFIESFKE